MKKTAKNAWATTNLTGSSLRSCWLNFNFPIQMN